MFPWFWTYLSVSAVVSCCRLEPPTCKPAWWSFSVTARNEPVWAQISARKFSPKIQSLAFHSFIYIRVHCTLHGLAQCLFMLVTMKASKCQGFSPRGNWQRKRSFNSSVKSCTWKYRGENMPRWWEHVKRGSLSLSFFSEDSKLWKQN